MEISKTRVAAYVGAGAVMGAGVTALASTNPKALALGVATGLVAGGTQSYVHNKTGSGGYGWTAATAAGVVSGSVLLGPFGLAKPAPFTRGSAALAGGLVGAAAPILAGIVLYNVSPNS